MTAAQPLPVRLLNLAGDVARRVGLPLVSLEPDVLEARVMRATGLQDFGEADYREGLETLCRSFEQDADLTLFGRLIMQEHVTNALVSRLRLVEASKRTPEMFEVPLVPPLLVTGLPRSGTTLLHRLLALSPDARPLLLWELFEPIPGPGPDRRRQNAHRRVAWMKRLAPDIDAKHHVDPDEPEECMFLLDPSMLSVAYYMLAPVNGYLEWARHRDPLPAYRLYLRFLQYFQATTPGRRLTLKAPIHAAYLDFIHTVIPDVMMVQTHRDPAQVVPSVASLQQSFYNITCQVDLSHSGPLFLDLMTLLLDLNLAARKRVPKDRLLDVHFDDLVRDPLETTRNIHTFFGLEFVPGHERAIRRWMRDRPRHRFGKHTYRAEHFGLTAGDIDRRFEAYRQRFVDS